MDKLYKRNVMDVRQKFRNWLKDQKMKWDINTTSYLYKREDKITGILEFLLQYEVRDVVFDIHYKKGGEWMSDHSDEPNKDTIHCYILLGDPNDNSRYLLKFWYANKYYASMNSGYIKYYPDYTKVEDEECKSYKLYNWKGKTPSKKIIYKYHKLINKWLDTPKEK